MSLEPCILWNHALHAWVRAMHRRPGCRDADRECLAHDSPCCRRPRLADRMYSGTIQPDGGWSSGLSHGSRNATPSSSAMRRKQFSDGLPPRWFVVPLTGLIAGKLGTRLRKCQLTLICPATACAATRHQTAADSAQAAPGSDRQRTEPPAACAPGLQR